MTESTNPQIKANLKILQLMRKANESIKYPKIRLQEGYTLALAGSKSHYKGSINITDGMPYGSNIWYGRINTNGTISYPRGISDSDKIKIEDELNNFSRDPANYANLYGKLTNSCMFCGLTLTNQQSIAVGYGPICAEKYGLPHGDLSKLEAYEASHGEIDLASLTDDVTILDKPYTAKAITVEELIVELEEKLIELRH